MTADKTQEPSLKKLAILVGLQGSGKTYYCRTMLPNWIRISQDEGPRTFDGVVRRLEELIAAGEPRIVIDRTNPMRSQRDVFTRIARQAGYRVTIIHFDVPEETCRERIAARGAHPTLDQSRMNEAIARYQATFGPPQADECDELTILCC